MCYIKFLYLTAHVHDKINLVLNSEVPASALYLDISLE